MRTSLTAIAAGASLLALAVLAPAPSRAADCPPNASFDQTTAQCVCDLGYTTGSAGCVLAASAEACAAQGPHRIPDPSTGACTCSDGHLELNDGTCGTYDAYCRQEYVHAFFNAKRTLCQCDAAWRLSADRKCTVPAATPTPSATPAAVVYTTPTPEPTTTPAPTTTPEPTPSTEPSQAPSASPMESSVPSGTPSETTPQPTEVVMEVIEVPQPQHDDAEIAGVSTAAPTQGDEDPFPAELPQSVWMRVWGWMKVLWPF